MATPWDQFIDAMERRKKQLDELLASYREFKTKLDSLPPEIAAEAQRILTSATVNHEEKTDQDMLGKSAMECAREILKEHNNEPMHFSDIAKEAIRRGYKGRGTGTESEITSRITQSFWAALHRSPDFETAGKGNYRIRRSSNP